MAKEPLSPPKPARAEVPLDLVSPLEATSSGSTDQELKKSSFYAQLGFKRLFGNISV